MLPPVDVSVLNLFDGGDFFKRHVARSNCDAVLCPGAGHEPATRVPSRPEDTGVVWLDAAMTPALELAPDAVGARRRLGLEDSSLSCVLTRARVGAETFCPLSRVAMFGPRKIYVLYGP